MAYPPQDSILTASDGTIATLKAVGSAYGEMGEVNEGGTVIHITTGGSPSGTFVGWVTGTGDSVDPNGNVTFNSDATADQLVCGTDGAGVYRITANVTMSATATKEIQMAIYKNATRDDTLRMDVTGNGAGNDVMNAIMGFIELAAGDYVSLRFSSDTNGLDITVKHVNVAMERLR